ncbi:MAG: dihydrolipoamide acetyltransferase family protein, partial [Acidimicrobiia bacterium]
MDKEENLEAGHPSVTAETEMRLPQFGMGMIEGTIVAWFKKEGDAVVAGEVVLEIEAAKTIEELVSPADGVLHQILVEEGATVPVHELLAVVAPVGTPPPEPVDVPGPTGRPAPTSDKARQRDERRQITPRARKLAVELDVDLDTVVGTGPGGRVTDDDVAAAAEHAAPLRRDTQSVLESDSLDESVPLSGMRATTARRMQASLQSSAQLTLVTTADVTDLVTYRKALGEPRPTYADFVVRAVAMALRQHPFLNSVLERDEIRLLRDIHIGVATALDDGLVVPVVRFADQLTLADVAAESARLTSNVRSGSF